MKRICTAKRTAVARPTSCWCERHQTIRIAEIHGHRLAEIDACHIDGDDRTFQRDCQ
jgi:hypothetical protein